MSGAMRFTAVSVRQSNDCTLTRASQSRFLHVAHDSGSELFRSGVFGAGSRRDLGLDVEAHVIRLVLRTSSNSSASVGMRAPSARALLAASLAA